jgi:hypothetical protein
VKIFLELSPAGIRVDRFVAQSNGLKEQIEAGRVLAQLAPQLADLEPIVRRAYSSARQPRRRHEPVPA